MFGLGLDYGLGFTSNIGLRQDPQLRVSHLATILSERGAVSEVGRGCVHLVLTISSFLSKHLHPSAP